MCEIMEEYGRECEEKGRAEDRAEGYTETLDGIVKHMLKKGHTVEEIAVLIGISVDAVSKYSN